MPAAHFKYYRSEEHGTQQREIICGKVAGGTVAKVQEPRERKADGRKTAAASDVPAKAIAAAGKTPSASNKPRWTSIGICCTLAWAFLINAAGGEAPTGQLSWQVSYFALALAMVAFGFIARSKPAFVESPMAGYVAAAIGALGAVALLFSSVTPALDALEYPATIVCSCVLGWLYLQWGMFYARVNQRTAIGCLFIGNIAASVLKCAAHFSRFRSCASSPWRCPWHRCCCAACRSSMRRWVATPPCGFEITEP